MNVDYQVKSERLSNVNCALLSTHENKGICYKIRIDLIELKNDDDYEDL